KSSDIDSLDGFYIRASAVWQAILEADLPDGGKHHRTGSFYRHGEPNEEMPRDIYIDGQPHKEWLNFKHPAIFALAKARDYSKIVQDLDVYNPMQNGFIKDQSNNPYMP
ncbi:MAG: hypothetical protein ACLFR0_06420, partial [Alphaproteobacteria bacterium]